MPKRYETLELIRQKVSMSQTIAKADNEYGLFAGASPKLAQTIALLTLIKDREGLTDKTKETIDFYLSFLDKKRKAYFASTASEISQLGFILGIPNVRRSALKHEAE